jgi:uncharacterized lipoprotein YajG
MKILCIVSCILFFVGCATPPKGSIIVNEPSEIPSIQKQYSEKLSQVKIGMTLEDFKKVIPEAYVGGQSREVTAYELVHITKSL